MSDYYKESPLPLFATRAPSVNSSATSAAAADSLGPATLNAMQRRVYEFLCRTPSTDEEITNELEMNASTVRPRRIELAKRGLIVEAGTRRTSSGRMATIWRRAT
jgi:transcription initiation factor IIE alpha subunit